MPAQRITMKKLRELIRLKFEARLTHRQIGRALNISPGTVSYYVQAANQVELTWPIPSEFDDKLLLEKIEPVAKQLRNQPKFITPEWHIVHGNMKQRHMTLMVQWSEYAAACPDKAYSYSQFTRLYKKWCKKKKVTMRLEHQPGEEAYIDFAGTTLPIYCRQTQTVLFESQLFIMALGASQYTFAYATRSQSLPDWIDAHKRAFDYFGGTPQIWVPDNLKAGITNSCQFEPEANPTYADMAEHYGAAVIPARPYTPQDKSIAENAVLVASRWIIARLKKQRFYNLNALNNAIRELLTALNHKPFQKRQGSRYQQFIEHEKAALRPLPQTDYILAVLKYQTLAADYHVKIEGHYYSAPYQLIYETVLCRYTQTTVEIFHGGKRVASHERSFEKDKKTTVSTHMPKAHQQYAQWTPQVFLDWGQRTGPGVYHIAQATVDSYRHPQRCSKIHFGLKRLCKRFGAKRLNQACRRALVLGCLQYKSIQSILENGLDNIPHVQPVPTSTTPLHTNVRGTDYYQQHS